MKKAILYAFICVCFLIIVIVLNGLYLHIDNQNDEEEEISEQINNYNEISEFSSHLPLIVIETNGNKIEKDTETWVRITFTDSSSNNSTDATQLITYAAIKYRGSSSYYTFDKKQYRIELKKDLNSEKTSAYSIFSMAEASDWVLNGPFLDRSLTRNYLGYKISRELLPWAPDTRYCEVFVDGQYQGLYIMVEPITKDEGRLNLSDYSLISGQTAYIIKTDRPGTEESAILTHGTQAGKLSNELSISYPAWQKITDAQHSYIISDLNNILKVLYSDYFDDEKIGYTQYIDVDSFVDYFIINEFMMVNDAGSLSTYLYKDIDSKLCITTWDFNNGYDNVPYTEKSYTRFYLYTVNWFDRLIQDKSFVDKVIARYEELRKDTISDERILKIIDDNVIYLDDAVDRNFEVWGYTFGDTLLSPDSNGYVRDPRSFEEAIQMLKESVIKRGKFLDENIDSLYDYCIN